MPVFNIPAEYYGLVGIGNAIGDFGASVRDRREKKRKEEREDFVFEEAKREKIRGMEQDIIRRTGQGSEAHIKFLEENQLPTEGILVPQEVRNERRKSYLAAIPEENRTKVEQAELNWLEGKPMEGFEAQLESIRRKTDLEELQISIAQLNLKEAELSAEQKERARTALKAKYNIDDAELDAAMQFTAYEQARANLGLTRANTNAANASAERQRAEAADAETGLDTTQIRQLTTALNNSGSIDGLPFTTDFVKRGVLGQLEGEDAQRFKRAYTKYNLGPQYEDTIKRIRKVNDSIRDLKRRRATEAGKQAPNQDVIDDYTAQIASLRDEGNQLKATYEAARDKAFGVTPSEGAPVDLNTRPPATSATTPEGIDPDELRDVALDFGSIEAIEASSLPEEQKKLLKTAFIAASAVENEVKKEAPAPPPKEAESRSRMEVNRETNKLRDEKIRLTREIAGLERNISATNSNPMSSNADRARITGWRAEIKRKQARLEKVNELLRSR